MNQKAIGFLFLGALATLVIVTALTDSKPKADSQFWIYSRVSDAISGGMYPEACSQLVMHEEFFQNDMYENANTNKFCIGKIDNGQVSVSFFSVNYKFEQECKLGCIISWRDPYGFNKKTFAKAPNSHRLNVVYPSELIKTLIHSNGSRYDIVFSLPFDGFYSPENFSLTMEALDMNRLGISES